MVPEAPLEQTEHGIVPAGRGWFVLNARDAPWFVGAGNGPCVVFAVGALENHTVGSRVEGTLEGRDDWGAYTVDEAALRHGAGVEEETNDADVAYARFPELEPTRYRGGWLPGDGS